MEIIIKASYVLDKEDKQKQEQFALGFEEAKNLLDGEIQQILCVDEYIIRDYQTIHQTWRYWI
jgi:hypothetical protein